MKKMKNKKYIIALGVIVTLILGSTVFFYCKVTTEFGQATLKTVEALNKLNKDLKKDSIKVIDSIINFQAEERDSLKKNGGRFY